VLYVATVHYKSPQWIEIQTRHLRENISVPYQVWTSLEGIDPAYGAHFDRVLDQWGSHAGKLNHLAMEISFEASKDDLIMFLDGDAFPIADPMPLIEEGLAKAPLVAVRRAENVDEPQPHPCFCVTTVGAWDELHGDWTSGPKWVGARGKRGGDVGGNLLRRLELSKTPWIQVLRTNHHDIDPLYFGVYGDVVYHHGAGFRGGELSPAHRDHAPRPLKLPRPPGLRQAVRAANGYRWRRWERETIGHQQELSRQIIEKIERGDQSWLEQLR
jgi:hypothetical protein